MTNPLIMDDGEIREMTDKEVAAHQAMLEDMAAALVTPDALKGYAAQVRYNKEIAGTFCTIGAEQNVPVQTDRASQAVLTGIFSAIKFGLRSDGAVYKFGDGKFRGVSNADMMAVCLSVLVHVQTVFAIESALLAGIDANPPTITDRASIDSTFAG